MTIPNCGFSTNTYSSLDLVNVFPVTKFYNFKLIGSAGNVSHTQNIVPPANYSGTDYTVFSTAYYGYVGSGGTYGAEGTSGALHPIVISNITNTQFTWNLQKNTSNNVNIFIIFMVVWNSELNYTKTY